jgi:hypothetical protein
MQALSNWISRALSEGDGSPSSARAVFVGVVLVGLVVFVVDFSLHGLTAPNLQLFGTVIGACGLNRIAGRFAETKDT